MNDITIDDIYENSNISDIDIYIENTISLKLINKDYASIISTLGYSICKLMDKIINITNLQIEDCKENDQDNIIIMTRYIDISKNTCEEMEKKNKQIVDSISHIENIRHNHINHIYTQPISNIYITYDYSKSTHNIMHNGIIYNMGPCIFTQRRESKSKDINNQRHCSFLINKLFNEDFASSANELLQLGSYIIIKILENKKIKRLLNH